jgi:hypothetical protein
LATDHNDHQDSKPLTREQYRKQQQQQELDFKQRDKRRVEVERQYARTHQQPDDNETMVDPNNFKTERWRRTNRRLNWTIGVLIGLMLITYLVLFFIN